MNVILEYNFYDYTLIVELLNFGWSYIKNIPNVLFDTNNLMLCYIGIIVWFISFIDTE
jgi:hypothetical protein